MSATPSVVIIGGGAAGFFAAIRAAEQGASVVVLEKTARFLSKVRISGGGRCNVTHACFEPRSLVARYPRGGKALIGPFHRFQPQDTVEWFASRGVRLKTEADGRMFPDTDASQTIIDCLMHSATEAGVLLRTGVTVRTVRVDGAGFAVELDRGEILWADRVLLATGGCRSGVAGQLAVDCGHTLVPPVPSLFTLEIGEPWLREIPGLAVEAEVSVPGTSLRERGPVLVTHWGLSGPAILRLSAWGARILHGLDYHFPLRIDWLPGQKSDVTAQWMTERRTNQPGRLVLNTPLVPGRLWEKLATAAGVESATTWNRLTRDSARQLVERLHRTEFLVSGKSLNKDEFVTCGGVPLGEVDFRTMESRITPGLHFAGEILDVDGVTGGFNFQAAWTTGWLAGSAMAGVPAE